jgi:transcriptional regulator with XRE-family HTH domain
MMGLGYNDIAEDTLMSSKRVAAIERGLHDISVTDLKKLADYFKIDLMEIVSNYENKFNKQ